ncbi:unnamed protein product [Dibothriocephalus latus]|uniref:Peptidase S9 prolyl oligopeptidase catalytic domain-containing protein n=1 Tax=Dibothriocephalus latus TaxID=60516 RepID=A0A3P7LZR5_DIBLA|nr:unnamed protein product [Dibothriocephalus latus]
MEPPSNPIIQAKITRADQLTAGEWEVLLGHIFLDEVNSLILFEGLREHPLWPNVYAVGYGKALGTSVVRISADLPAQQLANEGLSPDCGTLAHSIAAFDAKSGLLVLASSNHTHVPGFAVCQLHAQQITAVVKDGQAPATSISRLAWLKNHRSFVLRSSVTMPTQCCSVLFIFSPLFFRAQILCHYGYAVLLCDCRGSTNRGAAFAGHIKLRLGVPELDDHVQFLKEAARQTGLIDLNRVAIHGSSYGKCFMSTQTFKLLSSILLP